MILSPLLVTFFTFIMLSSKSPTTFLLSLISLTTIFTMKFLQTFLNSWSSLLLFLMMIGGLLILFLYMIVLSPNPKSPSPQNLTLLLPLLLMMLFPPSNLPNSQFFPTSFISNTPLMVFSVSILFLLLFSLSFLLTKNHGPLRST